MSLARRMVRLYPGSFRARWGHALEAEAGSSGWRSVPNLAVGIADMWLHPVLWPADSRAQRHGRAATLAITVAGFGWFVRHLVTELDTPLTSVAVPNRTLTACALVLYLGLLLVAPRPRFTREAALTVLRQVLRRLVPPAFLATVTAIAVHAGLTSGALLACWWTALALGVLQTCRLVACLDASVAVPPRPWRLRLGIATLAIAVASAGLIIIGFSVVNGDVLTASAGAGLLLSAAAVTMTLRDLRQLRH